MRLLLIALGALGLILVGMLFVGGVSPFISVAPETVFHWGPVDVTNTMFTSWVVVVIMIVAAYFIGRNLSLVPSGFAGAVEAAVVAFYDLVVQVAGERNGRRFFPVVATIFFYILVSNYFGLLPINNVIGVTEPGHGDVQAEFEELSIGGLDLAYIPLTPHTVEAAGHHADPGVVGGHGPAAGDHADDDKAHADDDKEHAEETEGVTGVIAPYFRSVMTDVNAPLAIAIFSFIFVEYWGLSTLGPVYLTKFFNFGRLMRGNPMGIIDVFVGLLEFISELSRMVSFTFRLFGNIFAGEVLLLMGTFLVPFLLVDVFYGLELFVGLIQAFVFAMLTLVFAQTAVSHHGEGGHGEHAEAH